MKYNDSEYQVTIQIFVKDGIYNATNSYDT